MPPSKSDLLFIAPYSFFFPILVLQLSEVFFKCLDIKFFLKTLLLNDLLYFLHLLIEHLEELWVLFILNLHRLQLLLTLLELQLQLLIQSQYFFIWLFQLKCHPLRDMFVTTWVFVNILTIQLNITCNLKSTLLQRFKTTTRHWYLTLANCPLERLRSALLPQWE